MVGKLFPNNTHAVERGIRILLGIGLLSLAVWGPKTAWGYLGIIPFVTGLVGSCPLYTLFGISTCRVKVR